jgi:MFS family permease
VLTGPLRHRQFRSFILYTCYWHMALMVGAPFISMYWMEHVGMPLFEVLLLWTIAGVGGALLSQRLGRWADRFGQRPVLVLCTAFKSINMLTLLSCPRDPEAAFWLLAPVFMVDAFLNAGITIANNGYLLKHSPRENRTMFVAAGTAYAGLAGGLVSVAAGALLAALEGWSFQLGPFSIIHFHLLFGLSVVMRLAGALLATRVSEPQSVGPREVLGQLVVGARLRMRSLAAIYRL